METKIRSSAQAKKDFANALNQLAYSQQLWTVFEDFLDYSLLMFRWHDVTVTENDFEEIKNRYPHENQQKLFAEAFKALGDIADNDGEGFSDPFGDYFMEHFGNKFKGQFFTPESVCDMIAKMQGLENLKDRETVCDPSCGSGRMRLSAAKINRKMIFYAADLDLNCCKMTVINFMLNTMEGEVAWMNSLSMEHWKSWHIKRVFIGSGYIPFYQTTGPGETRFIERLKNSIPQQLQSKTESKTESKGSLEKELKVNNKSQILLF